MRESPSMGVPWGTCELGYPCRGPHFGQHFVTFRTAAPLSFLKERVRLAPGKARGWGSGHRYEHGSRASLQVRIAVRATGITWAALWAHNRAP